tara:strand:- start:6456 stop:7100 length:645 start_codon:yes stop_codon:yes gene_type:complete
MVTIMMQSQDYYIKNPNHVLKNSEYENMIKICKKNNKKIGLAVCDILTFSEVENLNFDFYKLLSVSNTNIELINILKSKKKHIYISTGLSNLKKIKKSVKLFKNFKKITILHTPMTYDSNKLNFQKIDLLKKIFKVKVGYSNHCDNVNTLYALSAHDPSLIFLYIKPNTKKKINFPDNKHSFSINKLEDIKFNYLECLGAHKISKDINNTKIFN